jgi:hypothetical protein
MSTESDIIKRFTELINSATPSITRSQAGLKITLKGSIFEIPTSTADPKTISKTVLIKK